MAQDALSQAGRWRLRRLPVCASTELELDRWLMALAGEPQLERSGLVVVARRQRHGRGQWQRQWVSPAGGLWLSAAFAWPCAAAGEPGAPLTLAAAVGLALQLEALGLRPQIKWPNDLLLDGRKLAGILSRLRLQGGRVRWARVGIGINGINRVPPGAISLGEALQRMPHDRFHPRATASAMLPMVLQALTWAQAYSSQAARVHDLAEERLLRPSEGWLHQGQRWQVIGLSATGALRLERDADTIELQNQVINPETAA